MFSVILKSILGLTLCASLVSSIKTSSNVTTTTTTTTEVPLDLSGDATGHFETSVKLDHDDTIPRATSRTYSYRGAPYVHKGTAYEKNEYEEQVNEYDKNPRSYDGYYKGSQEDGYPSQHNRHTQHNSQHNSGDYPDSYEPADENQQHHGNQDQSYEHHNENNGKYPYTDQSKNAQPPYGHQDYSKDSYESKENDRYHKESAPYVPQYAYEVSHKQPQQTSYEPLDVPDTHVKSGHGPVEIKVYPKESHQPEYYPRPKPTKYILKSIHSEEYQNKAENHFPAIPKEAGYAPNDQKEPGYLQTSSKGPSYSQQAGYLPRHQEQSSIHQIQPKEEQTGLFDGGKLAIYIKHLGHKESQNVPKERQGYLLVPILPHKAEQKLAELKKGVQSEYKQAYQNEKEPYNQGHHQRQIHEKESYDHKKVSQEKYTVQPKVAIPYDDGDYEHQDEGNGQPRGKGDVSQHISYGFRPVSHPAYRDIHYENPKITHAQAYSGGEITEKKHLPYLPTAGGHYKGVKEIKVYSGAPHDYDDSREAISSFSGSSKYEPVAAYKRAPEYSSPYDVTTLYKSVPIKTSGFRPSIYSSLPHVADYGRIAGYSSLTSKPKNSGISQLYSTHYRNIGERLATEYEHPKLDSSSKNAKSLTIFLQKPKEQEQVVYRPSYSSKSRISAKTLADLGLHGYDFLHTVPKSRGISVGRQYYNLHRIYPGDHEYTPLSSGKSGSKY